MSHAVSLLPFCSFYMCYLFNDSSRTEMGVTFLGAPVSAWNQSVWLLMPNPFSETQVHALKLCLCFKSVSVLSENHVLVLNRTQWQKLLPCSKCQWWSTWVDLDAACFTQRILVGSLMPVTFIFSLLQPSVFSEKYGLLLVFYSWCFGIFLIYLLQPIFVCLLLSTTCDICAKGAIEYFLPFL